MSDTLDKIGPSEPLGRQVRFPDWEKNLRKNKPVPKAFYGPKGAISISVDRLDQTSDAEMTRIADDIAASLAQAQEFYGWSTILAEQAASSGRTVRADPELSNRFHAEIDFNIGMPSDSDEHWDQQKAHGVELASYAKWRPRA